VASSSVFLCLTNPAHRVVHRKVMYTRTVLLSWLRIRIRTGSAGLKNGCSDPDPYCGLDPVWAKMLDVDWNPSWSIN
jgi:xanthine dehydrogenase iron-sulfur cluster and FAD-binding subunit A